MEEERSKVGMATNESETSAVVLEGNGDGRAANSEEPDDNGPVGRLLKEAETIQAILEKIPSKEGESLLRLVEDRTKRFDDVEQKINKRLETWSIQLRDLLNRFSESIDGRCDAEIQKRKEDVDNLHRQLDGINDVWKRMELITASFETVRETLTSNGPSKNNTKRAVLDTIRKKWPSNVKHTVRDGDEINDILDQFSEAIKKNESIEAKRKNDTLDRYLNLVKGQLK